MNELYRDYLVIAFGRFDERAASWYAVADISREGSFKTLTGSGTHKDRQEAERVARELAVDWIDRQFQRERPALPKNKSGPACAPADRLTE